MSPTAPLNPPSIGDRTHDEKVITSFGSADAATFHMTPAPRAVAGGSGEERDIPRAHGARRDDVRATLPAG
jgi:hypothetical protein